MATVIQYPHYLFAVTVGDDSVQDENGNWTTAEPQNTLIGKCREETDGRGSEIQVAGGTFHRFTSLVQLPKGTRRIDDGTTVFVSDHQNGIGIRVKGKVLKFDSGQLHARLWI